MSTVITVENLGKKYTLHHQQREQYTALRDVITNGFASLGNRLIHPFRRSLIPHPSSIINSSEDFWALKDVSFEVKQGDRIGIIGRNGAGKSTLLKILSRITEPTTGSIKIKGRVASLLEVGTGFHPELTGRENIFLNGAILGMGRQEIRKKFDEIVEFAEIEKFLDTPVKRYSSGMYVRLAFAVAAHLEPEILIVDEVLAVGDIEFQKKCLGKMEEVGKEGRTVLFVSHNMGAVQQLCERAILLVNGAIAQQDNNIEKVISTYLSRAASTFALSEWLESNNALILNHYFSLSRMAITNEDGICLAMPVKNDVDLYVTIEFDLKYEDRSLQIGFALYDNDNSLLFWSFSTDGSEEFWPKLSIGKNVLRTHLPKQQLNEGAYRIMLLSACYHREWILKPDDDNPYVCFEIKGGLSQSPYWYEKRRGLLAPVLNWQTVAKE